MARIIVIEGSDYCGKSTYAKETAKMLTDRGIDVVVLGFPRSDTEAGSNARKIIADANHDPEVAARFLAEDFKQALDMVYVDKSNRVYIFDRFYMSAMVLQGEVGRRVIEEYGLLAHPQQPESCVLMEIPYEEALRRYKERLAANGRDWDEEFVLATTLANETAWLGRQQQFRDARSYLDTRIPTKWYDVKPLPKYPH